MPKLKKVKVGKNSMSWDEVIMSSRNRMTTTSIPQRELNSFLSAGRKVKKIIIQFD